MSEETLDPPLPPIDARTEAVAERLFGLKWALRKDSTEIIHEEWRTASKWIRDGYLRQAIEVLAAADQAHPASADGSDHKERMRDEYRELTARAGRLRDMLQRYADGTLDFEPTCPITLLSRQLDVMDAYANLLRCRAKIEHVNLETTEQEEKPRQAGRTSKKPTTILTGSGITHEQMPTMRRTSTNHPLQNLRQTHAPTNRQSRQNHPRTPRARRTQGAHWRALRWCAWW